MDDLFRLRNRAYTTGSEFHQALGAYLATLAGNRLAEIQMATTQTRAAAERYREALHKLLAFFQEASPPELYRERIRSVERILDSLDREMELIEMSRS